MTAILMAGVMAGAAAQAGSGGTNHRKTTDKTVQETVQKQNCAHPSWLACRYGFSDEKRGDEAGAAVGKRFILMTDTLSGTIPTDRGYVSVHSEHGDGKLTNYVWRSQMPR